MGIARRSGHPWLQRLFYLFAVFIWAHLWFVANWTYILAAPSVVSLSVTGTQVSIEFDNALDTESVPDTSAFAIKVGSVPVTVSRISIVGSTLTLSLASSVPDPDCDGADVTASYTAPAGSALVGEGGEAVASFANRIVANSTDLPPAVTSVVTNAAGNRIIVTFCEELAAIDWWSSVDAFQISASQSQPVIRDVLFGAKTVTILLPSRRTLRQGEEVTLSYDGSSADDEKELRDADQGNLFVPNWSDHPVTNVTDTEPEPISGVLLYDQLTVTFDQALDEDSVPSVDAWSFGNQVLFPPDVSNVSVKGSTVVLELNQVISPEIETFLLEYRPPGSSPLRDQEQTHEVGSFSDLTVTNETPAAAPMLISATANGMTIILTYDLPLLSSGTPAGSDFTIGGTSGISVSSVEVEGSAVVLTLNQSLRASDNVVLTYTNRDGQPGITGRNNRTAADFSGQAVDNLTLDLAPTLVSAAIGATGRELRLTFSAPLLATALGQPHPSSFALAGTDAVVSAIEVDGAVVTIALDPAADSGEQISLSYSPPSGAATARLTSADGQHHVAGWGAYSVNNRADGVPRPTAASLAGDELVLTFDRPLESATPPLSAFSLTGVDTEVQAVVIADLTVTITLAAAVPPGVVAALSYSIPTTSPLMRKDGTQQVAGFSGFPVTNLTLTPPQPLSFEVEGAVLTITFDADLDTGSSIGTDAFSATVGGAPAPLTEVEIASRIVTLTLTNAVADGATVHLTFNPPNGERLAGIDGTPVVGFADVQVANRTDSAPTLVSAIADDDGTQFTLRFSESLLELRSPSLAVARFALADTDSAVTAVSVRATEVTLTLDPALHETDAASVSYMQPTEPDAARLRDADQGQLAVADISGWPIDNQVDTAPRIVSAVVDGASIRIAFDQDLDLTSQPQHSAFTILPSGTVATVVVSNDSATGRGVIELSLAEPVEEDASVSLTFTPAANSGIFDPEGNPVSIENLALTNVTDTPAAAATAVGEAGTIQVDFDQVLNEEIVPDRSAFTLSGTSAAPNLVSVSQSSVTISVSPWLREGDTPTLTYVPPATNGLIDATGTPVPGFVISVINKTDTAPAFVAAAISGPTLTISFDQLLDNAIYPGISSFSVEVGGTAADVGAVEAQGSMVTLRLRTVARRSEAVNVSYTADPDFGLRDQSGHLTGSFGPVVAAHIGPPLPVSAVGDGDELVIEFDTGLDPASAPLPAAFRINDSITASLGSIATETLTLVLSEALPEGAALRVRYRAMDAGGSPLQGIDGASVITFDSDDAQHRLMPINQTDTPPSVVRAEVVERSIRIEFDQDLDLTAQPAVSGFSLSPAGTVTAALVTNGSPTGSGLLVLSLEESVREGDAIRLTFVPTQESRIVDPEGNAATIVSLQLENQTETPTTALRATANGETLQITFDQSLGQEATPDTSAFSLSGTQAALQDPRIAGATLTLTISPPVAEADVLTVSYERPTSNPLVDVTGTPLASFSLTVSNETDTAPELLSLRSEGDGRSLILQFSEALQETETGLADEASFTLGGTDAKVNSLSIAGDEVTLSLSPRLHETDTASVSYTPPTDLAAARLRDADQGGLAVGGWDARPIDNRVDTAPRVLSAVIDGDRIELRFDQDLDPEHQPAASDFSLSPSRIVSSATLSNDAADSNGVVVIVLATGVREGDSVTLTFSPSGVSAIVDPEGNAATLDQLPLTNLTETPTLPLSAVANQSALTVTFDQLLNAVPEPDAGQFVLTGTEAAAVSIAIDGSSVTLTVAPDFKESDSPTLTYSLADSSNLVDQSGSTVPGFTISVSNETDTAPIPLNAAIAGAVMKIEFDQALDEVIYPGIGSFNVTVDGTSQAISSVQVNSRVVTLRLQHVARHGEAVGVAYTRDPDYGLRDLTANLSESFGPVSADHIGPPLPISATADGSEITIAFDGVLDQLSIPPTTAFLIDDGVSPMQVSLASQAVVLTLNDAVAEDAGVRVRYQLPGDDEPHLQGTDGKMVRAFDSDEEQHRLTVTNLTDTAPQLIDAWADLSTVWLQFDQTLDLARQPSAAEFESSLADLDISAASLENVDGHGTVSLTTARPLVEDEALSLTYSPSTETARMADPEGNAVEIGLIELENRTDTSPIPISGTVDGAEIEINFDQPLYEETRTIPADHFAISGAGSAVSPVQILISNDAAGGNGKLRISLDKPAHELDDVSVHYYPAHGSVLIRDDDPGQQRAVIDHYPLRNLTDTAPVYVSGSADTESIVVVFDQPLAAGPAPPASAFRLGANGLAVSDVTVDGTIVMLTLADRVAEDSVVRLTYTPPASGSLQDTTGHHVEGFSEALENRTDYAPYPVAAYSDQDGTTITAQFDQGLNVGMRPLNDTFQINGTTVVDTITLNDSVAVLTLATEGTLREGEHVTLEYVAPAIGGLQDDDLPHSVAAFVIEVDNRTDVAPIPIDAWLSDGLLTIRFDQLLFDPEPTAHESDLPPNCDWVAVHYPELHPYICAPHGIGKPAEWFTAFASGKPVTISKVEVQSDIVELTIPVDVSSADSIAVSYTVNHIPGHDEWKLRDRSEPSHTVERIEALQAQNRIAAVPIAAELDPSDRSRITLTFDANLSDGETPPPTGIVVVADGVALAVDTMATNGAVLTLRLLGAVAECSKVRVAYDLNADQPWLDARGFAIASFELSVRNLIDARAGLTCVHWAGSKIVFGFEQSARDPISPESWRVQVNGVDRQIDDISGSGETVTLTLDQPLCAGDWVEVVSSGGWGAGAFSVRRMIDRAGPCPVGANVNLQVLKIDFDQELLATSIPESADFTIINAPPVEEVTSATGQQLSLRLSAPGAGPRDDIEVQFEAGSLRGEAGVVESFVLGVEERGRAPRMTAAYASREIVLVLFDQPLLDRAPANSQWIISLGGQRELDVADAIVGGSTVLLELNQPLRDEDQPALAYIARERGGLAGRAGHRVATDVLLIHNVTQTPPTIVSATADGSTIELEFDQRIEPGSADVRAAFGVVAGRRHVGVTSIEWRSSGLTVQLAERITALDAVDLHYREPEHGEAIVDLDGKQMLSAVLPVVNLADRPGTWPAQLDDARIRASDEAELRREVLRELADESLRASLVWPPLADGDGVQTLIAKGAIAAEVGLAPDSGVRPEHGEWRLHLDRLDRFERLDEFFQLPWVISWSSEARPRFVDAWRIDVTDLRDTPTDHAVELVLRVPRPAMVGPYRAIVFDLLSQTWSEAAVALEGSGLRVRLRGPALLLIAAVEPVETVLNPGLTELVFSGASGTLLSEFATMLDPSVLGAWVRNNEVWRYCALDGPALELPSGRSIWVVRPSDLDPVTVVLPAPFVSIEAASAPRS